MMKYKLIIFVAFFLASYDVAAQGVLSKLNERLEKLESKLQENEATQQRALQRLQRQIAGGSGGTENSGALEALVQKMSKRLDTVQAEVTVGKDLVARVDQLENVAEKVEGLPAKNDKLVQVVSDLRGVIEELVVAQAKPKDHEDIKVKIGGQIRPRFEARDAGIDDYDLATTMRVRTHVDAKLSTDARVFIQVQDVRAWGEETHTLNDFRADNFDLHQGYFEIEHFKNTTLSMRVGRQALSLGGQRLIGAVDWAQQGRAFDGVRLTATPNGGKIDLVGMKLAEASLAHVVYDAYLFGAYAQITQPKNVNIDFYGFYNRAKGNLKTDQFTFGGRLAGNQARWNYRFEGAFQTGKRNGDDVKAYMIGGRIGAVFGGGRSAVTLWYDYLSGDDDLHDHKTKVFDTLFATNHKFYGFADLFLDIPAHTAGRGLQDVALKMMFKPITSVSLGIDVHAFFLAKKAGLTARELGQEIDLTMTYRYSSEIAFVGGYSYVIARDGLAQIGRLTKDLGFGYVMTNVAF